MAQHYIGNALYNEIENSDFSEQYLWCKENIWILLYGNKCDYTPKIIAVVSNEDVDRKTLSHKEKRTKELVEQISPENIPVFFIRFDSKNGMNKVYFECNLDDDTSTYKNSSTLKEEFEKYGLDVNSSKAYKEINDKTSSDYHEWQRCSLGNDIIVTDLDLIRKKDKYQVIELKRSFKELSNWNPYPADYPNFKLIHKFCKNNDMKFYIVYNQRKKDPFLDDVSRLKIYEIIDNDDDMYKFLSIKKLNDFISDGPDNN